VSIVSGVWKEASIGFNCCNCARAETPLLSQEACHTCCRPRLPTRKHSRAVAAGGVLSHQPAAGGGARAEAHRELLARAPRVRARNGCLSFLPDMMTDVASLSPSGFPVHLYGNLRLSDRRRNAGCVWGGEEISGDGASKRGMSCIFCHSRLVSLIGVRVPGTV
jgi:hypothetical protein